MSKRHQSSRRRSYGRRQHELHERPELSAASSSWSDEVEATHAPHRWAPVDYGMQSGGWLRLRAAN